MKLIFMAILALTVNAHAVSPQTKLMLVTCTNKASFSDRFQMTAAIVFAPNSVQKTTLTIGQSKYIASGEYQQSGEFYYPTALGSHDELFASWGVMKTGAGELVLHPTSTKEKTYMCLASGYQG